MLLDSGNTTYGAYYNLYAASAGYAVFSTGSGVIIQASICPKNWQIPTGDTGGDFSILYNVYSGVNFIMDGKTMFALAGSRTGDSITYQGTQGVYWSAKVAGVGSAYGLTVSSTAINSGDNPYLGKYSGYSIRCIAK